jgi:hypothetical protein
MVRTALIATECQTNFGNCCNLFYQNIPLVPRADVQVLTCERLPTPSSTVCEQDIGGMPFRGSWLPAARLTSTFRSGRRQVSLLCFGKWHKPTTTIWLD